MDARILKTIIEKFDGGPVGVSTIAAAIGEDASTIEEVYEPFLVQHGFLQRTPRGRVATPQAYRHFGFIAPGAAGDALSKRRERPRAGVSRLASIADSEGEPCLEQEPEQELLSQKCGNRRVDSSDRGSLMAHA